MEIVEFPWFSFFWWIFSVSIKPVVHWAYATTAVWPNSGSPVILLISQLHWSAGFPPCRVQEQGRLRAGGERLPLMPLFSLCSPYSSWISWMKGRLWQWNDPWTTSLLSSHHPSKRRNLELKNRALYVSFLELSTLFLLFVCFSSPESW